MKINLFSIHFFSKQLLKSLFKEVRTLIESIKVLCVLYISLYCILLATSLLFTKIFCKYSLLFLTVGGLIFKMGEHAEKIHVISSTVEAQEKRIDINHNIINEIHNDLSILRNDISYMKSDIHEIKNRLN